MSEYTIIERRAQSCSCSNFYNCIQHFRTSFSRRVPRAGQNRWKPPHAFALGPQCGATAEADPGLPEPGYHHPTLGFHCEQAFACNVKERGEHPSRLPVCTCPVGPFQALVAVALPLARCTSVKP